MTTYPLIILICEIFMNICIFVIEELPLAQNCTPKVKFILCTHIILYLEI